MTAVISAMKVVICCVVTDARVPSIWLVGKFVQVCVNQLLVIISVLLPHL